MKCLVVLIFFINCCFCQVYPTNMVVVSEFSSQKYAYLQVDTVGEFQVCTKTNDNVVKYENTITVVVAPPTERLSESLSFPSPPKLSPPPPNDDSFPYVSLRRLSETGSPSPPPIIGSYLRIQSEIQSKYITDGSYDLSSTPADNNVYQVVEYSSGWSHLINVDMVDV